MISFKTAGAVSAIVLGLAVASAANATVQIYTFDQVDPAAGLGSGPFGTVTVDDAGGNLAVSVVLAGGYEFRYSPDNNHQDLAFSLTSLGKSITGLNSPFAQDVGSAFTAQPFGSFNYAINCPKGPCTPGWNPGVNPTSMSFTILGATFASLTSKTYGGENVFFAADVVNAAGKTGDVGATFTSVSDAVPEPAAWAMMIAGFGMVGVAMRRRTLAAA